MYVSVYAHNSLVSYLFFHYNALRFQSLVILAVVKMVTQKGLVAYYA